jgi:hypothetical protein
MSTWSNEKNPHYLFADDPAQQKTPEPEIKQPHRDSEKLLDWLVNYWAKPTITAREIYTWGPHSIRDKKTTLSLAQILVEPGWLVPMHPHLLTGRRRRDKREWKIGGRARL